MVFDRRRALVDEVHASLGDVDMPLMKWTDRSRMLTNTFWGAALLGMVVSGFACSAAPPPTKVAPQPAPEAAPAAPSPEPAASRTRIPDDARALAFAFVPQAGEEAALRASESIRTTLASDGYWLVEPAKGVDDARIEVKIKRVAADSQGFLGAQVAPASASHFEVALMVVDGQSTVEWLVTSIVVGDDAANARHLDELVERLSASPRLAWFAKSASAKKASGRATPRVATGGPSPSKPQDAAAREEALWSESGVRRCRNGRRADACDAMRTYLAAFPEGPHAAVAKAAIDLAAHHGASAP